MKEKIGGLRTTAVTAICLVAALVLMVCGTAEAGKARFSASVSPKEMRLTVTPGGGITGDRYATVNVQREKVGSSAFCTKIRWIDVAKGGGFTSPSLGSMPIDPKRCYFKRSIRVSPFTDDEIHGLCSDASGSSQRIESTGTVFAWHHRKSPDVLRQRIASGWDIGRPSGSASIRFVARVQCQGAGSTGAAAGDTGSYGHLDIEPGGAGKTGCDLSGTWQPHSAVFPQLSWRMKLTPVTPRPVRGRRLYGARSVNRNGKPVGDKGTFYQEDGGSQLYLFKGGKANIAGARYPYQTFSMDVFRMGKTCDRMDVVRSYDTLRGMTTPSPQKDILWFDRVGAPKLKQSPVGRSDLPRKGLRPKNIRKRKVPSKGLPGRWRR
ncbi:MAG: hypothetical protein ACE5GY_06510 [Thermodesulfobacteriota bacterium]